MITKPGKKRNKDGTKMRVVPRTSFQCVCVVSCSKYILKKKYCVFPHSHGQNTDHDDDDDWESNMKYKKNAHTNSRKFTEAYRPPIARGNAWVGWFTCCTDIWRVLNVLNDKYPFVLLELCCDFVFRMQGSFGLRATHTNIHNSLFNPAFYTFFRISTNYVIADRKTDGLKMREEFNWYIYCLDGWFLMIKKTLFQLRRTRNLLCIHLTINRWI